MLEGPPTGPRSSRTLDGLKVVVAADTEEELAGAAEAGLATIVLNMADSPVIEKLTQALLTGVAREILAPGPASSSSIAASRSTRSTRSASSSSTSTSAG